MTTNASELMHGAHFAKNFVNNYLQNDIPSRLIRYRNGWEIDDYVLPNPELYLTYEPIALDHWPTIITVVISTNEFMRTGMNMAWNPEYRVSYSMRTYIWVRTEGSGETTEMRDRLTTVVRSALLDHPSLETIDVDGGYDAIIEEGTIREEFSDLTLIKGDRVLAGASIGYDLTLNEIVLRKPIGSVLEIENTVFNKLAE